MAGFAKAGYRVGFSQVELNLVSGAFGGKVYGQYPVDTATMGTVIENGRFAKYDGVTNKVNLSGSGEWLMIYNEEKLYDERLQNHKDFAMQGKYCIGGEIVPRLISIEVGDIFTTNAVDGTTTLDKAAISALTETSETAISIPTTGTYYVGTNGYLTSTKPTGYAGPEFQVIKPFLANANGKAYLADNQEAVKLMRIK